MVDVLSKILQDIAKDSPIYIHPNVLSFSDAGDKINWRDSLADAESRDTIDSFLCAKDPCGRAVRAALLSYSQGWVSLKTEEWDRAPWHCCAIAVINRGRGKGKDLVVWDCDPPEGAEAGGRVWKVLRCLQRHLITHLFRSGRLSAVYFSVDQSHPGQDRCLQYSLDKLQEWARTASWWDAEELTSPSSGYVPLSVK